MDESTGRPPHLFRLLLRLTFPASARMRYGDDIWWTLRAHLADARRRGRLAFVACWWREVIVLVWRGLGARVGRGRGSVPRARLAAPGVGASIRAVIANRLQDFRYAARSIARAPAFSGLVVGTLVVGIATNTAVFTVVNGVLLQPLPYDGADRLVVVWSRFLPASGLDLPESRLAPAEYLDYRDQSAVMTAVGAYSGTTAVTVGGDDVEPQRVGALFVTPNVFTLLRVEPEAGRMFSQSEAIPGGPSVAVIGHDLWQTRFGGDPRVVGRIVSVDRRSVEIVGVMPAGFGFPDADVQLWGPLRINPALDRTRRDPHTMRVIGRLAPGVSFERAQLEMATIVDGWQSTYPDAYRGHSLFLRSLLDDVVAGARPLLLTMLVAVGIVLLTVCANTANLLLARTERRRREMAVRVALGAGRGRVIGQLAMENALLCAVAGVLAVVCAVVAIDWLLAIDRSAIPRYDRIAVDTSVLFYTAAVTAVAMVMFGVVPLISAVTRHTAFPMAGVRGGTAWDRSTFDVRRILTTLQVALSMVLVVGAGLLVKSYRTLLAVDLGLDADRAIVARLSLPAAAYPTTDIIARARSQILERLRALPVVTAASAASFLPLLQEPPSSDFRIVGRPAPTSGEPAPSGTMIVVQPGLFEQMGIRIEQGRALDGTDRTGSPPVAIVNRAMADQFWPGQDPVGQRITLAFATDQAFTIVGVVTDLRYHGLDAPARPTWYIPFDHIPAATPWMARFLTLAVRTTSESTLVAPLIRAVVREVDAGLVVTDVQTMQTAVSRSTARPRFIMTVVSVFAAATMILGALGLYSVMSYAVTRRRREIGIRVALGATPRGVTHLILRQGLAIAAVGMAVGLTASGATGRAISGLLFDTQAWDWVIAGWASLVLAAVTAVATWLPARRASVTDPSTTLRVE